MRFLLITVGLIMALAGALIVGPSFVDWNKYKTQILEQLHAATGYEYKIGGNLSIAFLPFPHAVVQELEVATPAAQGGKKILLMKEASVNIALRPLLQGRVVVDSVVLNEPQITMEVAADGKTSWMTPELTAKLEKKEDSAAATQNEMINSIALEEISVKNAKFSYLDRRTGKALAMEGIGFTVRGESLFGPYTLGGESVYMGKKLKLALKSGKINNMSESLSLQADVQFPELATTISYSGVAAVKNAVMELQGETSFQTQNLAAFAAAFGDGKSKLPPALAKPVKAKGILTYGQDAAAYRNLSLGLGEMDATGSVSISGLAKKAPLEIKADLSAGKPFAIESLLPPPASGARKDPLKSFLPETLTLPFDVSLNLALKASALQYKGASFTTVDLSVEKTGAIIKTELAASGPGGTDIDAASTLTYDSSSVSQQTGAVTLSDPAATVEAKVKSDEPDKLALAFIPADKAAAMTGLLSKSAALNGRFSVKPARIETNGSSLNLLGTDFNLAGSYMLKARNGRDALSVRAAASSIDIDAWMKSISPAKKTATAVQPQSTTAPAAATEAGKAIAAVAASLKLPFDIIAEASSDSIRFNSAQYDRLAIKGSITGNALHIDTLSLQDMSGNNFGLSGNVGDVAALKKIDLSVSGATSDLQKFLEGLKVKTESLPKDSGPADMITEFKGDSQKLAFTSNVKALRGTLEASGSVSGLLTTPVLSSLTMRLRHPSYVDLARMFNPGFSSGVGIKKTLDVFGVMERQENVYKFSQVKASIGPATIGGNVVVGMAGVKPSVGATLELGDFPLDEILGVQSARSKSGIQAERSTRGQPSDVRWSRNAINTGWMHKFDMDVKATARTFSWGNWIFSNAGLNATLKDGALDLKQLDGALFGGQVALGGKITSPGKERDPLSLAGNVLMQDVPIEEFVKAFSGSQLVKARGVMSFDAQLAATGLSPAALVFDLNGKGKASGKDFIIEGFDLARLSRAIAAPSSSGTQNFNSLLGATMAGGSTQFDTLDGQFTVTEGVVLFDKFDLTGKAADVINKGNVNLPLWTIDMTSEVKLKEPADAPPLKVTFKGPLDRPAQTFAQNAMDMFFQKQLEGLVLNPLLDKLGEDGDLGEIGKGVLGNILGVPQKKAPAAQKIAPAPLSPAAPVQQQKAVPAPVQQQDAPVAPTAPEPPSAGQDAPQQAQPAAESAPAVSEPAPAPEPTPGELMQNLIEGIIQEEIGQQGAPAQ